MTWSVIPGHTWTRLAGCSTSPRGHGTGTAIAQVLSRKVVKALPPPAAGSRVHHDAEVKGSGARVAHAARGRERRIATGSHPDWPVQAARGEAKRLKRAAPTVAEVAQRCLQEHVIALRPKTRSEYESMLLGYVLPELGKSRLAALTTDDVKRLHDRVKPGLQLLRGPRPARRPGATAVRHRGDGGRCGRKRPSGCAALPRRPAWPGSPPMPTCAAAPSPTRLSNC